MRIFISIGSNQGERIAYLASALLHISRHPEIQWINCSSVYETAAWGNENQPAFLNQIFEGEFTGDDLHSLMDDLLVIEKKHGRIREEKWAARTLDLDIIYVDDLHMNHEKLTIPHPRIEDRRFVLIPMVEIAPDFIHPIHQKNQAALLQECPSTLDAKLFCPPFTPEDIQTLGKLIDGNDGIL